jgi:hypothetical protein
MEAKENAAIQKKDASNPNRIVKPVQAPQISQKEIKDQVID